jgi:hypothetical protein
MQVLEGRSEPLLLLYLLSLSRNQAYWASACALLQKQRATSVRTTQLFRQPLP